MTSEQAVQIYAAEAQAAEQLRQDAARVIAAGDKYLADGALATSAEANAAAEREDALTEMRIHHDAICRRPERAASKAYREWLETHPGDHDGANDASYAAYQRRAAGDAS